MIITKKAAVGFLLLAVIVFLSAQYTVDQMISFQQFNNKSLHLIRDQPLSMFTPPPVQYQQPILNLGDNAPLVITAVIELFTLVCYLVLKKLEPAINRAAEDFVQVMRTSDDQINP